LVLGEEDKGYVFASMSKEFPDGIHQGLEIQSLDVGSGENEATKFWLEPNTTPANEANASLPVGIRSMISTHDTQFREVIERLQQKQFYPFAYSAQTAITAPSLRSKDSRTTLAMERQSGEKALLERDLGEETPSEDEWLSRRTSEEAEFASRLAKTSSRLAVWAGSHIWWALRNPLLLQLEARLDKEDLGKKVAPETAEERRQLFEVLSSFRGQDARTELEFTTFSYIRQRAGALLLMSFLNSSKAPFPDGELKALEGVLVDSALDARVVLALFPRLRNEIIEGPKGIWIYGGVKGTVERYLRSQKLAGFGQEADALDAELLHFLRRFLAAWRKKKGFGSIADEHEVFQTVDAAFLQVLLILDQDSPRGLSRSANSVRAELNELVDKGIDCFDRAVDLLEQHHRLYVLSRLYQSRKMAADVLATWRRIIEGERDDGGELDTDGEQRVREYLSKVSNQALVQEYGLWLANRNPKLGVQVFADDKGKAPNLKPADVVALLRKEAPDAVKYYLEHLVFGKGHTIYVHELITYYLDVVLSDLQSSAASRETVVGTYEAYRALRPPKPTYRQFLTDNAPPDNDVWQSRLRLLQLLGGAHDYSASAIRSRIAAADLPGVDDLLVPETIILNGRERRHKDALRLLVHGLGDYDTAIAYCVRGGASIYLPTATGSRQAVDEAALHSSSLSQDEQAAQQEVRPKLFRALLGEFLHIGDISDRVEQTGGLLDRFGGWFDVLEVLGLLPDEWSVDIAADFLVQALKRLVRERHETAVARALSGAENLRVSHELIEKVDKRGAQVETAEG